jgi:hypothetical protein
LPNCHDTLLILIYLLAHHAVTAEICHWSQKHFANCQSRGKWTKGHAKNNMAHVGTLWNGCVTNGISQPSQRDAPRDFALYATVIEVEAELNSKIPRIYRTWMRSSMECTVALRWPIFKQKKGYATSSLGINHCSKGSSQPPSHDTVPVRNRSRMKMVACTSLPKIALMFLTIFMWRIVICLFLNTWAPRQFAWHSVNTYNISENIRQFVPIFEHNLRCSSGSD